MPKLVLPNGSLEQPTIELFARAGFEIERDGRCALGRMNCAQIREVFFTRPQAIPRIVSRGICQFGLCGYDCCEEARCAGDIYEYGADVLASFPYSRRGKMHQAAAVVLCTHKRTKVRSMVDMQRNRSTVYSEYPCLTRSYLRKHLGFEIEVERSPGSTEGHILIGEYDYGVCVTDEGRTLTDNGLIVLATLLTSPVVLITNLNFEKECESRTIIQDLQTRLLSAC